jgi:hypothetical protein
VSIDGVKKTAAGCLSRSNIPPVMAAREIPTDPLVALKCQSVHVLRMVSTPRRWNFQQAQVHHERELISRAGLKNVGREMEHYGSPGPTEFTKIAYQTAPRRLANPTALSVTTWDASSE